MSGNALRTADFDYLLPAELIASRPPDRRDAARMLVVNRADATITHARFVEFPSFIRPGDCVVLNNTQVVRARFFSDDGRIEILRLEAPAKNCWRCLVKPGKRLRPRATLSVGGSTGVVQSVYADGSRVIVWDRPPDESEHGHLALPPYIARPDEPADRERYQTVFADPARGGAIAAPTAGLHFTPELLAVVPHTFLTLEVGVGTFQPVRAEMVADHVMHAERYHLGPGAAGMIAAADRLVAVGTTVARVLEHVAQSQGGAVAGEGTTDIFIYPPFEFRAVGALLTNFHLPRSTLLMLVSAFAGSDLIRRAYAAAVEARYRFFSYGDCMLIV
jgi:S-adenosylmethionine:tRNA ribosyltransferase-isomerase